MHVCGPIEKGVEWYLPNLSNHKMANLIYMLCQRVQNNRTMQV